MLNFRSSACQGCADRIDCATVAKGVLVSLSDKIDVSAELACVEHILAAHTGAPSEAVVVASTLTTTIATPVKSVTADRVKVDLSDRQKDLLATLPVKVADKLRPMLKGGLAERLMPELKRGINPFPRKTQPYVADAVDMLLKDGFTRASLREFYIDHYKWSKETAFSRVSIVVGLVFALEIAIENGDRLVLAPSIIGHN